MQPITRALCPTQQTLSIGTDLDIWGPSWLTMSPYTATACCRRQGRPLSFSFFLTFLPSYGFFRLWDVLQTVTGIRALLIQLFCCELLSFEQPEQQPFPRSASP